MNTYIFLATCLNHVWKFWQFFGGILTFSKNHWIWYKRFQNFHNNVKFCTHKKVWVKFKFFLVIIIFKNNWNVNWKEKILKLHKSRIYANICYEFSKLGKQQPTQECGICSLPTKHNRSFTIFLKVINFGPWYHMQGGY